ncbi:MAG: DUF1836 domain-containing protein [Clostridia bacterium]
MRYNPQQIAGKLLRWEQFLTEFNLPTWDELPQIGLYMDQVIILLNEYLSYFVYEGNDEKLITATMVNNYVKIKLLPAPIKKKYGRAHLACLIMICTFKQTLSMAVVKKMLPNGDEEAIKRDYDQFVLIHKRLPDYFAEQVKISAASLLESNTQNDNAVNNLVISTAVAASFAKLMTSKIIVLQLTQETEPIADQVESSPTELSS